MAGRRVEIAARRLDFLDDLHGAALARTPLKAMCSMRWDRPCSASCSLREPTATLTASEAVPTPPSRAVTMRSRGKRRRFERSSTLRPWRGRARG